VSGRRCPGCAEPFRKGKRRALLQEDGSVKVTLVCAACAKRAFAVVRPIGSAANLCTVCKDSPARVCSGCARRARAELVAPVLLALHGMAQAAKLQGKEAEEAAYEHASVALARQAEQG
jgi:hypothetical protein